MGSDISCIRAEREYDSRTLLKMKKHHDQALEQAQAIDHLLRELSQKMMNQMKQGRIHHGLLLLQRKCIAEGVREMYMIYAYRKYMEVVQRSSRSATRTMTAEDYLGGRERTNIIPRDMCKHFNVSQRES